MGRTLIDALEWCYEALNSVLYIFGFSISPNQQKKQFNGLSTRKKLIESISIESISIESSDYLRFSVVNENRFFRYGLN